MASQDEKQSKITLNTLLLNFVVSIVLIALSLVDMFLVYEGRKPLYRIIYDSFLEDSLLFLYIYIGMPFIILFSVGLSLRWKFNKGRPGDWLALGVALFTLIFVYLFVNNYMDSLFEDAFMNMGLQGTWISTLIIGVAWLFVSLFQRLRMRTTMR